MSDSVRMRRNGAKTHANAKKDAKFLTRDRNTSSAQVTDAKTTMEGAANWPEILYSTM